MSSHAIKPEILAFSLPKMGEAEHTNQDRYASGVNSSVVAIADGAGSSLYPGEWAEILVQSFCQEPLTSAAALRQSFQQWLTPCQENWRKFYLEKLKAPSKKWWQGGSSTKSHGSATFLGLVLSSQDAGDPLHWSAIAVGDSCLFRFNRQSKALNSFPMQAANMFKSTSACLASLPEYPSAAPEFQDGVCDAGEDLLLATDALAQWILRSYENQSTEWEQLLNIKTKQDFLSYISTLRQTQQLKNDDTTLILIKTRSKDSAVEVDLNSSDE